MAMNEKHPVYRPEYVLFGEWVDGKWSCPFDDYEAQKSCVGFTNVSVGYLCKHNDADLCRCRWLHEKMRADGYIPANVN